MVCLEGGNSLLSFVVGLFILVWFSSTMGNIFFIWMLMEFVFFFVMMNLIVSSGGKGNVSGVIFYLFVQALGGVLVLSSMMVEMLYFGNYYYLGSNVCLGCLYLGAMGLMMKMGMFPFYVQVYQIMNLINFNQVMMFMLYPKVVPMVMLYSMVSQLDLGGELFIFSLLVMLVSGVQGLVSTDLREFLAWSGLGQLGWIFVSIMGSFFCFLFFFWTYVFVLMCVCFMFDGGGRKVFPNFSGVGVGGGGLLIALFLVFFMSGLAPFLMFYLKLFLLFSVGNFTLGVLGGMMVGSMGLFLLYVRVMQMMVCLGGSMFLTPLLGSAGLKGYAAASVFFFFFFGGVLLLI
uniref:NADH-ubiquinone oxidoreductase chain 2 n=1 Tax=Botrylloides giganteus TaxID=2034436 RepID=A0A024HWD6_9ASCI|nr:NADH dehydrogenase subunit 2 [Botrylloides giganteus]